MFFVCAIASLALQAGGAPPIPRLSKAPHPTFTDPELYILDEFIVVLSRDARSRIQVSTDQNNRITTNIASLQSRIETARVKGFEREFPEAKPYPVGHKFPDLTGHYIAKVEDGADLKTAMDALAADPNVEHVEKIGVHRTDTNPNDTFFLGFQWNMKTPVGINGPFGINGPAAWKIEHGSPNVIIGVLDTGVRYFHKDLGGNVAPWSPAAPQNVGNIFINPGEIPANGIDDDGNGRIDDVVGYDFLSSSVATGCTCNDSDCNTPDNEPDDFNGHGTHVSGIAAAITNNGRGVAGTAGGFGTGAVSSPGNGAKVLPLRVGWNSTCGGLISMAAAAQAMNYVATMVDKGYDITAINCSWGSSNTGGIAAALAAVVARDVMVVKAAGNSNVSTPDFLQTQPGVVNVGGTAQNGTGYSASNFGPWVHIAAPAVGIRSTVRNSADPNPNNDYYADFDGTSMAAPHVCGVAALLESCRPDLSVAQKLEVLQETSVPYNDVRDLGDGIVNANNAVHAVCLEDLKFSQPLTGSGQDMASNLDTSDLSPSVVHSDDFISDGRPITSLIWWGSETPEIPVFRVDDGASEDSIGVNDGAGNGGTFGWANRFTNTTGGPVNITTIQVAFGTGSGATGVTVGDAVDAVIWLDPAATGNMVNATPVLRWPLPGGVHANDGSYATHTVPGGVVVPAGADFYVGCGDIQTQNDGVVRFPASIDQSAPLAVRSWAFFPANITDPFSENLAGQSVNTIDGFGIPGNWLIRAGGDPAPAPDGWFVSFHEPLATGGAPQQALGLYYCDESIVTKKARNVASCDSHQVFEYRSDLANCCLIHAQPDSRSSQTPAQAAAFQEEQCFKYGLDIQAVIGTEYSGPGCVASSTGRSAIGNFWGWHSTTTVVGASIGLQPAFASTTTQSGSDWLYGPWTPATPSCSVPNLAFNLLTTTLAVTDPDADGNGLPDACEAPPSVLPDPSGINKTRFVSFSVPAPAVAAGPSTSTALRVHLISLHHVSPPYAGGPSVPFTSFEGEYRWVGPPAVYSESTSDPTPFTAASLQCTPYYQDWSTIPLLHVTGSAIAPSSVFEVEHVSGTCLGMESTCSAISAPLQISTTRWGDVEIPYNPPSTTTQPDLGDVASLVNKFKSLPGAPIKARGFLVGDDANGNIAPATMSLDFGFSHIAACVDAFKGKPYPHTMEACP